MSEYRYTLTRDLGGQLGLADETLVWVMLNPSTADELTDDATIRRVKAFTARERYRRLTVVNLFALRATRPPNLLKSIDPVGGMNRMAIVDAMASARGVVFAWGATIPAALNAAACASIGQATYHAGRAGLTPMCLGKTANGSPRHPLYVKGDTPLVQF